MVKILKFRYKYTSAIENQRNNIWTIIRQSNKFSCQSVNFLPVVLNTAKKKLFLVIIVLIISLHSWKVNNGQRPVNNGIERNYSLTSR